MLFTTTEGEVKTKIAQNGELMVYHPLAPLPAGFSPGWWGVENKIANVRTDTQGLRFDVTQLQAATGATAIQIHQQQQQQQQEQQQGHQQEQHQQQQREQQ